MEDGAEEEVGKGGEKQEAEGGVTSLLIREGAAAVREDVASRGGRASVKI